MYAAACLYRHIGADQPVGPGGRDGWLRLPAGATDHDGNRNVAGCLGVYGYKGTQRGDTQALDVAVASVRYVIGLETVMFAAYMTSRCNNRYFFWDHQNTFSCNHSIIR